MPSFLELMTSSREPGPHLDSSGDAHSHRAAQAPTAMTPNAWPSDKLAGGSVGLGFLANKGA